MSRRVYTDFDAELLLRLGNRNDITATQRGFFLNDAYLYICAQFAHVQLQAISAGETLLIGHDNFTPGVTDLWFPTAVKNMTDGYIIDLEMLQRAERLQQKPTSRPYKYYWYGGVFYFEALADTQKTIKVWYKKTPPIFTASPIIDQMFDLPIIMEAARIGFESVREFDAAKEQEGLMEEYARKNKLPVDQATKDHYRQGWKPRFR